MNFLKSHYQSKKPDGSYSQKCIFITRGAGVGKSFLIKIIIEWLRCCTSNISGVDPVMICAPTGTAAKNINGKTLHNALRLPVQHGKEAKYLEVSAKVLKMLRQIYNNIHTFIIDEISMVSAKTLENIHRRLSTIKNCNNPFGNVNMIVVGDFYQ